MTTRVVHRPARTVHPPPQRKPYDVEAPPTLPDGNAQGNQLMSILPMIAMVGSLTVMMVLRNPAFWTPRSRRSWAWARTGCAWAPPVRARAGCCARWSSRSPPPTRPSGAAWCWSTTRAARLHPAVPVDRAHRGAPAAVQPAHRERKAPRLETYLSYRLGLRMFSEEESRTVLDTPGAFHLPALPGFGYLKVDTSAPAMWYPLGGGTDPDTWNRFRALMRHLQPECAKQGT